MDERTLVATHAGDRIALIAESFARVTGGKLVPEGGDPEEVLWSLPGVVVAHATEEDPVFFYGNRAALDLFEMRAEDFIRLPSRLSAEPMEREERAALLARVTRDDFIPDYAGVRVASTGKRFRIEGAIVWNLIDAKGQRHGQAAWFEDWEALGKPTSPST